MVKLWSLVTLARSFVERTREVEKQERQGYHRGSSFPRTQPFGFRTSRGFSWFKDSIESRTSSPCSPLKSHHKEYPPSPFVSLPLLFCLSSLPSSSFVLLFLPATVSPDVVDYRPSSSHFSFVSSRSVGGNERKERG